MLQTDNGSGGYHTYLQVDGSIGEVKLFHYGSEKLNTTSTGVDVTGTVTADGLTVNGGAGNGEVTVDRTSGASILTQAQAALGKFGTTSNHNLQFMANNSGYMTVTTAGNVGIGTASPSNTLHVKSSNPNIRLEDSDGASNIYAQVFSDASGSLYLRADAGGNGSSSKMQFDVDGSEAMRIYSGGQIGLLEAQHLLTQLARQRFTALL